MKPKFFCLIFSVALLMVSVAAAQTAGNSSASLPAAPGATADPPAAVTLNPANRGIAAINVEAAIFNTNEGQRDLDALQKKFEPKSNELKSKSDEIEALKKKANASTAEAKAEIERDIEQKQKSLDREAQDAREDFQSQQNEVGQRILQKMASVIIQCGNDNGAGMILDTSQPWPQGAVLANGPGVDLTRCAVDQYNQKSGIAPPAQRSGAKPAVPGAATKPAAPSSKPATTTPPPK